MAITTRSARNDLAAVQGHHGKFIEQALRRMIVLAFPARAPVVLQRFQLCLDM